MAVEFRSILLQICASCFPFLFIFLYTSHWGLCICVYLRYFIIRHTLSTFNPKAAAPSPLLPSLCFAASCQHAWNTCKSEICTLLCWAWHEMWAQIKCAYCIYTYILLNIWKYLSIRNASVYSVRWYKARLIRKTLVDSNAHMCSVHMKYKAYSLVIACMHMCDVNVSIYIYIL